MVRFRSALDPFLLALVATLVAASLAPVRGAWAEAFGHVADAGIALLFLLQGARLSREAIIGGAGLWKLHLAVLATTFVVFPLVGLAFSRLPFLSPPVAGGLLFLTLLPSTVQSSIAFTAVARGNVAAAICSASFSNLLGIAVTPFLANLLMRSQAAGMSWEALQTIVLQLLVPFVAGHLLRPWIAGWVARNKRAATFVDRGSILLVVYAAFSAAVVEGLWHKLAPADLALIALCSTAMLALILTFTWIAGRTLALSKEDAIVLQFCGSKKSLVTGVPMAGILFPAAQVGVAVLPLMIFHQLQLVACALLAAHFSAREQHRPEPASLAA